MNLEDLRKTLIELDGKKVRLTTKRSTYVDILNVRYIPYLTGGTNCVLKRHNYMYVTCGFNSAWKLPQVFDLTDILSVEVVD